MKFKLTLAIAGLVFLAGCIRSKPEIKTVVISDRDLDQTHIIADTILYSVDIVNFESTDEWKEWRLRYMNTTKLVEEVFENVYAGKLQAYDYFSDKLLTPEEIQQKENEPDFSRELIEEVQFEETWFFSAEQQYFHKNVHAIVLAYALYTEEGHRRGLKPVFRIKLNE